MVYADYLSVLIKQSSDIAADIQPLIPAIFAPDPSLSGESLFADIYVPEHQDHNTNPPALPSQYAYREQGVSETTFVEEDRSGNLPPPLSHTTYPQEPLADPPYSLPNHSGHSRQEPGKHEDQEHTDAPLPESPGTPAPLLPSPRSMQEEPSSDPQLASKDLSSRKRLVKQEASPVAPGTAQFPPLSIDRAGELQGTPDHSAPTIQSVSFREPPSSPALLKDTGTHPPPPLVVRLQETSSQVPESIQPAPEATVTIRQTYRAAHPTLTDQASEKFASATIQDADVDALLPSTLSASSVHDIRPVPTHPYEQMGGDEAQTRNPRSRSDAWREEDNNEPDDTPGDKPQMEPQVPLIQVTIGRIEVRATPSSHHQTSRRSPASRPALSLKDYLEQRRKGQA